MSWWAILTYLLTYQGRNVLGRNDLGRTDKEAKPNIWRNVHKSFERWPCLSYFPFSSDFSWISSIVLGVKAGERPAWKDESSALLATGSDSLVCRQSRVSNACCYLAQIARHCRRDAIGLRVAIYINRCLWRSTCADRYSFHAWNVTLYILRWGGPGSVDVSARRSQCSMHTVLQIFYPVVHQKVFYTLTLLA